MSVYVQNSGQIDTLANFVRHSQLRNRVGNNESLFAQIAVAFYPVPTRPLPRLTTTSKNFGEKLFFKFI